MRKVFTNTFDMSFFLSVITSDPPKDIRQGKSLHVGKNRNNLLDEDVEYLSNKELRMPDQEARCAVRSSGQRRPLASVSAA